MGYPLAGLGNFLLTIQYEEAGIPSVFSVLGKVLIVADY